MTTTNKTKLVTFTSWCLKREDRVPVSINPAEVASVVDYCGPVQPGQMITMKKGKTHLVWGSHDVVVAKLNN